MSRLDRKALLTATAFLVAGVTLGPGAQAQGFEIETGFERLSSPQTLIEGLHRLYVGHRVTPNFSFGQGFYSAAMGDAGGAFFWGFEGALRLPLTERLSLGASGFFGGGGGASQVNGDGLMLRAGVSADYRLTPAWDLQLTASWIRIAGAPIDGAAFGIGFRHHQGDRQAATSDLAAVSVVTTGFVAPSGVLTRSGGAQPTVALEGVQAMFALAPNTRLTFGAAGAAMGAQGYMQVMAGVRRSLPLGRGALFVEGSAGFGGGGDVDTGSGLLVQAGVGLSTPVSRSFDLELTLGAMVAPTGGFRAAALSLGLVRAFERPGSVPQGGQRWAYSGGFSMQQTAPGFFNGANPAAYVVMQESSLDYFVGERVYVTGNGQTTVQGGAAGYAIGMVGLGYAMPLGARWTLSFEGHLGAAGGGGVNTAGGIIGGLRAEVDYRVTDRWSLSLGLGRLTTLRGAGMAPNILTLGVKIPFVTHR